MQRSPLRTLTLLALAGGFAACNGSSGNTADVRVTSLSPPPGSTAVSRRVDVRAVFDAEVDPASISPATCRIERQDGGGPEAVATQYDVPSRLLTITPVRALTALTAYRVVLTRGLRTVGGAPFATQVEWTFTTAGGPVWERSVGLAPGELLACEPSRRGGVLAVWAAPDASLQFARGDGIDWSPPVPVGIADVQAAVVADDTTGRVVVAATSADGTLRVATALAGSFDASEALAPGGLVRDLDVSDSGHVALAYTAGFDAGHVRSHVPGVGWTPPFTVALLIPHVSLRPAGDGVGAVGFAASPLFGGGIAGGALLAVDALGTWSLVDPLPVSYAGAPATEARFRDERVLLAVATFDRTAVYERTALGWSVVPVGLPVDPSASDLAQGPNGIVALAAIEEGNGPILRRRLETTFTLEAIGDDSEPAPATPTIGVAVDDGGRTHVLWTAAVDTSAGAPVRLMSTWLDAASGTQPPLVVDGPFAATAGAPPVQALRVVAFGASNAVAVWSRGGEVRSTALR